MSYSIDWDARRNGGLRFLKGAPLNVLIAYTLHADDYGNAWPGTRSDSKGLLNLETGLSHESIVNARKLMVDHGLMEVVPYEVVKELYLSRPKSRKPAWNVDVYHIGEGLRHCGDEKCQCRKILLLEDPKSDFPTSRIFRLEVSSSTEQEEVNTNQKGGGKNGKGKSSKKKEVQPLTDNEWNRLVVENSFGGVFESMRYSEPIIHQVHGILRAVGGVKGTIEELRAVYQIHEDRSNGKELIRMKRHETIATAIEMYRADQKSRDQAPVSNGPRMESV